MITSFVLKLLKPGQIHLASVLTATYVWSVESVADEDANGKLYGIIDGGLSATHALTAVTGSFIGEQRIAMKLKTDILKGGNYYKFKLVVTDADGTAAASTYEVKTNSVPSKGNILFFIASKLFPLMECIDSVSFVLA